MSLRRKKILITSGPTWVPIDKIRVISNIATGRTGILIAKEAVKLGANVVLLLGPTQNVINNPAIKIKSFRYFNEFKELFIKEIKNRPDVVIHSAAVSDYQPKKPYPRKIKSDLKKLSFSLVLTPKLADKVKQIYSNSFFVIFKLEDEVSKGILINRAYKLLKHTRADLVVANTFNTSKYIAYIIDKNKKILGTAKTKEGLSKLLIQRISKEL
jgi:phosphopantothenoylcysteine decarboxylase/phosphopantothenate--cysteine ligase